MKKILLLSLTTIIILNANSEEEIDCYSILQQIDKLEKDSDTNFLKRIGSAVITGHYPFDASSKELKNKIRILKLKLSNCK